MSYYVTLSKEEQTQTLANWFPQGRAFGTINQSDSLARNFLRGLAEELVRHDDIMFRTLEGLIPALDNNDDFILDWERVVGIPDACFSEDVTGLTIETRWLHVIVKLAGLNIQTQSDYVALAALFGVVVTVQPGKEVFDIEGVSAEMPDLYTARFTIVITFDIADPLAFPYTFPITFAGTQSAIMECLFTKLRPANCQVLFRFI